jgi:hypothetical protein
MIICYIIHVHICFTHAFKSLDVILSNVYIHHGLNKLLKNLLYLQFLKILQLVSLVTMFFFSEVLLFFNKKKLGRICFSSVNSINFLSLVQNAGVIH